MLSYIQKENRGKSNTAPRLWEFSKGDRMCLPNESDSPKSLSGFREEPAAKKDTGCLKVRESPTPCFSVSISLLFCFYSKSPVLLLIPPHF